ncbi:hypothetical protein PVAND_015006 [Polypedilum vanderplanki]|uniref:Uncharacterized protein n=1 Tax=Polypedilum vanderplanki TaxID=319348 RepID=A0A9J6BBT1_POLVA|nr:hypothetical protein PVAND_015006 [Polypedilum vanderplanki]
MKLIQFLQFFIIYFLLVLTPKVFAETEEDYDAGYVEEVEPLPVPEAQVQEQKIPFEEKLTKKFSISEPAIYIPIGIGIGVLLNIAIVIVIVMMKRRRARNISYSKMRLNTANPVHSATVELVE